TSQRRVFTSASVPDNVSPKVTTGAPSRMALAATGKSHMATPADWPGASLMHVLPLAIGSVSAPPGGSPAAEVVACDPPAAARCRRPRARAAQGPALERAPPVASQGGARGVQ